MLSKILRKFVIWALRTVKITGEDKALVTTELLKNIDALPLRDAIQFGADGTVYIKGRTLELEQAQALKTGVAVLKDNFARKLIQEQLLYKASVMGLHEGINPEQIMFSKAIVWVIQNEEILISKLDSDNYNS